MLISRIQCHHVQLSYLRFVHPTLRVLAYVEAVQLHACSLSGPQYSEETNYTSYADERGFIALFPSTRNDYNCWDVASPASLTHDGGGDGTGLANIIKWVISEYNADSSRIFVTGSSSGCMMTNVMCATYPEVFAAASCYSGFPAGCLIGSPGSSPETGTPGCGQGIVNKTGSEWADIARAMHPGYHGSYPRTMIWHGTADFFVSYQNLVETLEQWAAVFSVSFRKNVTDWPEIGYTKMVYGDGRKLIGLSAEGAGHTVPVHQEEDLRWFGLD
jgi:acetylxylan esterase